MYCSHLHDPFDFFDYYIEVLGPSSTQENKPIKKIIKVIDIFGRDSKRNKNQPVFYIYDDGTVEKSIVIE